MTEPASAQELFRGRHFVPLPHMQGVADVEELFLPVQLKLVQCFRPRLPPEAINFLTVHTKDVAQIAVPPENRAEHVVKFVERHLIGDRDQADDHRAHLAQNRSQNQAFEGGCFNHLSRLLGSPDPRLFGALYLDAQAGGTKRSVDELTQAVSALSRSVESRVQPRPVERRVEVEHHVEPKSRHKNIGKWVAILIGAGAVFGAGYFVCWSNAQSAMEKVRQQAKQQVDQVIEAQPAANLVSSFLAKHSGKISLGSVLSSDGKSETEGIIIEPGDLKFGQPTYSRTGGALVPLYRQ